MDTNPDNQHRQTPYTLTSRDLEALAKSTITPEIATSPFVDLRRVDDVEGAEMVGRKYNTDDRTCGLGIPYFGLDGLIHACRLRRDHPTMDRQADGSHKQKDKYFSAPEARNRFYYPFIVHYLLFIQWLMDPSIPIIFVEGEKKALALMRIALENLVDSKPPYVVIGLSGVWNWRGKIGTIENASGERVPEKGPIEDFQKIPFKNRKVSIFFDANVRTNGQVRGARSGLSFFLRDDLGAQVFFAEMPEDAQEQEINGPDDLAYLCGDRAVLECIEQARPAFFVQPKRETTEEKIKRGSARRVLAEGVAKASTSPDSESAVKQRLGAKVWKRLCSLYAQIGKFKPRERDFLFTLQALVGDKTETKFYYMDLFRLLYPVDKPVPTTIRNARGSYDDEKQKRRFQNFVNRKIRKRFEQLEAAQKACDITFVEWIPGKEIDGETYPSFVRLLSLEYIEQIESIAICDEKYARNNFVAFEKASVKFVEMKLNRPYKRKQKKPLPPNEQIKNGWIRVKGNIKSTIEQMKDHHFGEWVIAEDLAKATLNSEALSPELMASPEFVKAFTQHLPENFKALLLAELSAQKPPEMVPNIMSKEGTIKSQSETEGYEQSPEISADQKTEKTCPSKPPPNVDNTEDIFSEIHVSARNSEISAENPQAESAEFANRGPLKAEIVLTDKSPPVSCAVANDEAFDEIIDSIGGPT